MKDELQQLAGVGPSIAADLRRLRKLLTRNDIHPESFTTDKLASYRAAFRELHCGDRRRPQQLQRSKTPDPLLDPSPLSSRSRSHVGTGDRGRPSGCALPAPCALVDLT